VVNAGALLLLGMIIGSLAGFFLTWWFAIKGPPPEPFFLRFLRAENRSARLNMRFMLHELNGRVGALNRKVGDLELELKSLKEKVTRMEERAFVGRDSPPGRKAAPRERTMSSKFSTGLERCGEICRLYNGGLSAEEIAQELRMGHGEVELVLSLDKKPPWVVGFKKKLKTITIGENADKDVGY